MLSGVVTQFAISPKYTATSTMYMVSSSSGSVVDLSDLNIGESISSDYVELIKTRPIIEGVIKTFFDHGGEHIQINVVDTKTLRDAQKNPENYKGLMVRVAGYMAYFTELDESAQEAIIYRTAHLEEEETA